MSSSPTVPAGFKEARELESGIRLDSKQELWLFSLPTDFDIAKLDGVTINQKGVSILKSEKGEKSYVVSHPKPSQSEGQCLLPLASVPGKSTLKRGKLFAREVTVSRDFSVPKPKTGTYNPPHMVPPTDVKQRFTPIGNGIVKSSKRSSEPVLESPKKSKKSKVAHDTPTKKSSKKSKGTPSKKSKSKEYESIPLH
eukprot:CFRG0391T1